jgi:hypothetical protein
MLFSIKLVLVWRFRIRKSKDRQHNDQKKKYKNDLQNTTDQATRTHPHYVAYKQVIKWHRYSCMTILPEVHLDNGCVIEQVEGPLLWLYCRSIYNYLYMQSVPIATKVMSSNPVHGEVYSKQHYVIISDLWQLGSFLWVLRFPPPINTDRHHITELLLKLVLNTTTPTPEQLAFIR